MSIFDDIFDADYSVDQEIQKAEGGGKLPTGSYKVIITDSEQTDAQYAPEGTVEFWFRLEVIEGDMEGRRVNLYPRLFNPEDKDDFRVKNGRKEFAYLCKGCGFTAPPSDSTDLHDMPFTLDIELKTAKSGKQYYALKGATPDGQEVTQVSDEAAHPFG